MSRHLWTLVLQENSVIKIWSGCLLPSGCHLLPPEWQRWDVLSLRRSQRDLGLGVRRELTTDSLALPCPVGSVVVVFEWSHGKGACFYTPGRSDSDHVAQTTRVMPRWLPMEFLYLYFFSPFWLPKILGEAGPGPLYLLTPSLPFCLLPQAFMERPQVSFGSRTGEHLRWVSGWQEVLSI